MVFFDSRFIGVTFRKAADYPLLLDDNHIEIIFLGLYLGMGIRWADESCFFNLGNHLLSFGMIKPDCSDIAFQLTIQAKQRFQWKLHLRSPFKVI
ncbi:hypothetical protein D6V26_07635 [Vibrio cholerae]|nr:hypothetical protein [Vibrio cholerae]